MLNPNRMNVHLYRYGHSGRPSASHHLIWNGLNGMFTILPDVSQRSGVQTTRFQLVHKIIKL